MSRYSDSHIGMLNLEPEITNKILKFMKCRNNFLIYLGNPGCGKTTLIHALKPMITSNFTSHRYWQEGDFFARIRKGFDTYSSYDYLHEVDLMTDDHLVIFDDLGSNPPNEWRSEVLFYLVDKKYTQQKPMIFTSNLTRQEIQDQYGLRFHSRFFDKDNIIIENFDSIDYRLKDDK